MQNQKKMFLVLHPRKKPEKVNLQRNQRKINPQRNQGNQENKNL